MSPLLHINFLYCSRNRTPSIIRLAVSVKRPLSLLEFLAVHLTLSTLPYVSLPVRPSPVTRVCKLGGLTDRGLLEMCKTKKLGGGAKSLGTRRKRNQPLNNEHPPETTNRVATKIKSIDILKCRI